MAGSTLIGRAHVEISADDTKLTQGLESARQAVTGWASTITTGILQGVGQQLFSSIVSGLNSAKVAINNSIADASNLAESINKVGVAFNTSADDIIAWSHDSATAMGQSQQQALEAASTFGLLFRAMGLGTETSADMSKQLVQLASDLASINNIGIDDALTKMRAGLIGESEPLRSVGVLLNETVTAQKAVQLGLAETTDAVSDQDKVLARYQLILDQTVLAQGDFARTSDQLANAQRILAAQIADSSAQFGQALLPIKLAFTRGLSDLITLVRPYGINIMDSFASGLADGIVAILPVLEQIRALFTYWLKPGSPPRIMPDLDEWGKEAAQVYLDSWGDADFDSLKQIGGVIESILRSFVASGSVGESDLVSRIFGSQKAIGAAISEFKALGTVSVDTFSAIVRASGPAGDKVADLVREYFNLAQAAKGVTKAQDDLNEVTQKYADALAPINRQLDAVRSKQQEIRDQQRLAELGKTLTDPTATVDEKQLARLEIQQIELEKQADAIEKERDTAVGAAEDKVSAAQKEQAAQQKKFDTAQAALDQQAKTNALIGEEIDLRTRLANEALAAQQKALRELEQAQREADAEAKQRLSDLERIHQAQLNFQLASTDTAGQLALLQTELARTVEGSADYYNILTRIATLQDKLKKEQSGDSLLSPISDAVTDGGQLQQASAGITKLSAALEKAFAALSGKDDKQVELNPAFQKFADAISEIKRLITEAQPTIQGFIDLVTGKKVEGLDTTTDPFADNFWLAGFIPGINFIITEIGRLSSGKWAEAWQGLKDKAIAITNDPAIREKDPQTFAFYVWIVDRLIPAIEMLAAGDWKSAVNLLVDPLVQFAADSFQTGFDTVNNWWEGVKSWFETKGKEASGWLNQMLPELFPFFAPDQPIPKGSKGPQDVLPPNDFSSFPGGGNSGGAALASFASADSFNTAQSTNFFNITQFIGTGGDFGGARQGAADGMRQAIIAGKTA